MFSPIMLELDKPLMDKKVKKVLNGFIEIVKESKHTPNKLRVDYERDFYNRLMQKWLDNNDIFMYLTHNKANPIIA